MENYEDYLKQVANLGGVNNTKPLQDFYNINGALIRYFGRINAWFELEWLQNKNLDDSTVNHILNTLNQQKNTLASLKFEASQMDITDYEGNTRTKLEKQLAYIKSEMVLEEADLVLQNLKQLKTTSKAEPKPAPQKNDSSFLKTFLRTEYGEGYTYEGDLLNNLPHGYGALYYPNKQLYAIGSWANGRLQNQAKVYYNDGKLWQEGQFMNGKLEGWGKLFQNDVYQETNEYWTSVIEAPFKNGKANGIGKFFLNEEKIYEGGFVENEWCGQGVYYNRLVIGEPLFIGAEGTFKNGQLNGFGKRYNRMSKTILEEGYFVNWELEGQGKTFHKNGNIEFIGNFSKGRLQNGKLYDYDGDTWYEGKFQWDMIKSDIPGVDIDFYDWRLVNGLKKTMDNGIERIVAKGNFKQRDGMYGDGIKYGNDSEIIEKGYYIDGYLDGEGEKYDGEYISMRGYFKKGQLHGEGVWYFTNSYLQKGKIYEVGTFQNGRLHGYGRRYNKFDDEPIEQGTFINGVLQGK